MSEAPFCAEVSRAVDEPVLGTASRDGVRMILVEHDGFWGRDAFGESSLPEAAKDRIAAAAEASPRSRVVLVKPPGRIAARPRIYVTGGPTRGDRVLVHDLPSYDAIADAPIDAMLAGEVTAGTTVLDRPLALVCTHGKRDRCCARLGVALASRLSDEPGLLTLEASHLGGHRFAAVVLTLPDSMTYGHLDTSDSAGLAAAIREGRLYDPRRFRGITGYDEPVQVADGTIRIARGLRNDAPLVLEGLAKDERGAIVRMRLGEEVIETIVRKRELPVLRPASCFEEPSRATGFEVRAGR